MKGYYRCECGKEFTEPNRFNSHKASCLIHLEAVGKVESCKLRKKEVIEKGNQTRKLKKEKRQEEEQLKKLKELSEWIAEEHTCEKCGKVMIEKYGSGRFCSRSCANSRVQTEEINNRRGKSSSITQLMSYYNITKEEATEIYLNRKNSNKKVKTEKVTKDKKLKSKVISVKNTKKTTLREEYEQNPKRCLVCESIIPYEKRTYKTCSRECKIKVLSQFAKENVKKHGGNLNQNNRYGYKWGSYKGFECDSSWELAYVVYSLEHEIKIERNTKSFEYEFEEKKHLYYPDFILEDGTYIEIKNYWTEQVQAKIDQFPKDLKYKILYYNDIKYMIDYCKEKYGKKYWNILYE